VQKLFRHKQKVRRYTRMKPVLTFLILTALAGCADFSVPGIGSTKERIIPVPTKDARILFAAPRKAILNFITYMYP